MSDYPKGISVEEARSIVVEQCGARRLPVEFVALQDAFGRSLGSEMRAFRDQPPFTNSAMDGFALRAEDLPREGNRRLRLIGTRLAGDPMAASIAAGECLRITTGAPLPAGADTVVIKERVTCDGESVVIGADEVKGSHVRPAGEDFRVGDIMLDGGRRIGVAQLAALASMGNAEVSVTAMPKVEIMTTGDELVMPGFECTSAQIYNSNGFALAAMLKASGIETRQTSRMARGFMHLPDDPAKLREAFQQASESADVIITSGGVSAGEADYLPALIAELGKIHFWKVRMRPGMPMLFGEIGRALVFCLPGNPVSTIATFLCLVRPGLAAMQGLQTVGPRLMHAKLAAAITKKHERTEFLRAVCEVRDDGTLWATPVSRQGSSMIRGLVEANALIMVPEEARLIDGGTIVQILPLTEFC
ncbi:MAG: gephyrin-like molybdotransferase Glp [Dokdonella sp.]